MGPTAVALGILLGWFRVRSWLAFDLEGVAQKLLLSWSRVSLGLVQYFFNVGLVFACGLCGTAWSRVEFCRVVSGFL